MTSGLIMAQCFSLQHCKAGTTLDEANWKKGETVHRHPIRRGFGLLILSIATICAVPALGEDKTKIRPDAGRGKAVAERLCASCHLMPQRSTTRAPVGIPSFDEIANKPKQTAGRIRAILIKPHTPMPNISLTRMEIEDIISYLDRLRKPSSGKRLLEEKKQTPKIKYPKKS